MNNWKKFLAPGVIIVLFALVPLVTTQTNILTWLFMFLLYVTLAQSWNILGGYTGQMSLGHAAFFGAGALATRFLWLSGLPLPLAFLAGGVIAVLFALIIGFPAFRLRGVYFIIATLALAEIARITVSTVLPGASTLPAEYLAVYSLVPRYYLSLILAVIMVGVVYVTSKSRLGLGMVAVREDEDTAKASGVNTLRTKLLALVISSFFAGLAGGAYGFFMAAVHAHYLFDVVWTFDAVLIVFIGGVGTLVGPILGALFYVFFGELFALYLPTEYHIIMFGILFILVILFLPGGLAELLGKARRLLTPKR